MDYFRHVCSSSDSLKTCGVQSCAKSRRSKAADASSVFEHLSLKPTVIDIGELQFPPSYKQRQSPTRRGCSGTGGNAANRQGNSKLQRNAKNKQQPTTPRYIGAELSDWERQTRGRQQDEVGTDFFPSLRAVELSAQASNCRMSGARGRASSHHVSATFLSDHAIGCAPMSVGQSRHQRLTEGGGSTDIQCGIHQ
eukprot:TRINITY_DN48803_c0_g1_i1.p1 TRINITY_DN48803_c0_g1~~TRINITY_DN48803_c0_g1_i1.p1  ORF type:complete len:195 (+),score=17.76 TRINITY_DN48803_c0_g1_i1:153-737(+)